MKWLDWNPARGAPESASSPSRCGDGSVGFDGSVFGEMQNFEAHRSAIRNEEEVEKKFGKDFNHKPTEPTKLPSDGFVGSHLQQISNFTSDPADSDVCTVMPGLAETLRGKALELWADSVGGQLFIVADEVDAARLRERRGAVLTVAELERVVRIEDPAMAAEVIRWKRRFDGVLSDVECATRGLIPPQPSPKRAK